MIDELSILVLVILLSININHANANMDDSHEKAQVQKIEEYDKEKIHPVPEMDGSLFSQGLALFGGIFILMRLRK